MNPVTYYATYAFPSVLLDDDTLIHLPEETTKLEHKWEPVEDVQDLANGALSRRLLGHRLQATLEWNIMANGTIDSVLTPGNRILAILASQASFRYSKLQAGPYIRVYVANPVGAHRHANDPPKGKLELTSTELVAYITDLEDAWAGI